MSVSFTWQVVNPDKQRPTLNAGTSSDIAALDATFPGRLVSTEHIVTLRAMARASGATNSLWEAIADKLEALQGSDYERKITLKIDTEF